MSDITVESSILIPESVNQKNDNPKTNILQPDIEKTEIANQTDLAIINSGSKSESTESEVPFVLKDSYNLFENLVAQGILVFDNGVPQLDHKRLESYIDSPRVWEALVILDDEFKDKIHTEARIEVPEDDDLLTQAKESLKYGLQVLKARGILTTQQLLSGGIFAGSNNLNITNDSFSALRQELDSSTDSIFSNPQSLRWYMWEKPPSAAQRNEDYKIIIGKKALQNHASVLQRAAQKVDITLSDKDAVSAALHAQVSHEFTHAIMFGLVHQGNDLFQKTEQYLQAHGNVPHPDFIDSIVRETLPRSIELFVLQEFMVDAGILSREEAQRLIDQDCADAVKQWAEQKHILEFCKKQNIPLTSLEDAFDLLRRSPLRFRGNINSFVAEIPQETYPYLSLPVSIESLKEIVNDDA